MPLKWDLPGAQLKWVDEKKVCKCCGNIIGLPDAARIEKEE